MDISKEKSEFNMHIMYLTRVDKILTNCVINALEINAHGWFHSLMALYREISTSMTKEETEKGQQMVNELLGAINYLNQTQQRTGNTQIPPKTYQQLFQLEIFLRLIMKRAGLLLKLQDDATKALQ